MNKEDTNNDQSNNSVPPHDEHKTIDPPEFIDGARVIKWAWAGQTPFGYVGNEDDPEREDIYGLAICEYDNEEGNYHKETIYRFSCNKDWETVQDGLYKTIEKAIELLPEQYKNVTANWQTK